MLALLLGTVSLFAAAPAQAQTTVWSGTMRVGGGLSGCGISSSNCPTALSDDDFTYDGVTYEITRFYTINGILVVELDKAFPSKFWVVHVGTSQFSLQDASFSQSDAWAQWSNSGLNFAAGASRTLSLRLVEPPAPTHTLSVSATPPCGATVTDTSEHPRYTVTLAPAPHTEEKLQSRIVTDNTAELWLPHRSIQSSGKLSTARNPFSHFRNVSPGFRGFEFRLSSDRSVTVKCLWTFTEDPSTPNNQPPPDTDTDGSGNGGGGGPGPGGGGGPIPPAPSGDASLSNLEISGTPFDFNPDTDTYTADVPYDVTSVTVTPTASHAEAETTTVTVNGETVEKQGTSYPVTLDEGENVITVVVTAENGTTRTYTVTVTRAARPTVSLSATPNPVAEGSPVTVTATLSTPLSDSVTIPVAVTRNTSGAEDHGTLPSITIPSGQTSGTGMIQTNDDTEAEDDETFTVALGALPPSVRAGSPSSVEVTITDDDQSGDATLSSLEIEEASLDFDPKRDAYTVDVPYNVTSVTVTPTANHAEAEITVNGETVQSGEDILIDLDDEGETSIEITVTAEDGTARTYTLTVMSCPREDERILEKLYEALGGDTWDENENWNSEEPPGQWFGVETNEDDEVISLRLAGNGLSGEMPRELLCLSELVELALWDNDGLSGEVPQERALAVERAALRDVAAALSLNEQWFEDYENSDFGNWHEGVTTDDDGRVTELDFSGTEDIEGTIPVVLIEQLKRLGTLYLNCTISVEGDAPAGVNVEEVCEEPEVPEEPSGGGGCALGSGSGDSPVFGLFLMTLLVFAALGRRARG